MKPEYLTGYVKTAGHIVLEKAVINSTDAFFVYCEGPDEDPHDQNAEGRKRGALATWFQRGFLEGVNDHGAEHILNVAEAPPEFLQGPGADCTSAGILAAGDNAYVWTFEGSGFCIMRILGLFGKKRITGVLSSAVGGEETVKLSPGDVLIVCTEEWAGEKLDPKRMSGTETDDLMAFFDPEEIEDDSAFDRRLKEFAGEGFKGIVAALAFR